MSPPHDLCNLRKKSCFLRQLITIVKLNSSSAWWILYQQCAYSQCTVLYLEIFAPGNSVSWDSCYFHHFISIGGCSFILFAIALRLLVCKCNSLVIHPLVVLRLAFRDGDLPVFCYVIVIYFSFRTCDLRVFCHAIAICLALCNSDWLVIIWLLSVAF